MGSLSFTFPRCLVSPWLGAALVCVWVGSAGGQTISTVTAPLALPTAIAFDGQGNLYIAETNHHVVRRVDPAGVLTTVAGTGVQGFAGDGGPAMAAMLDSPAGLVVDTAGDVYVADSHNQRVRRVDAGTGLISTVTGSGVAGFGGDGGAARLARLNRPTALAIDGSGNLYVADTGNHRVRQVAATTGVVTTVAGDGRQGFAGDGGLATAASIDSPSGLGVDAAGNLYLADTHNQRVRVVAAGTGLISTVAGSGGAGIAGDSGAAAKAVLALPRGLAVDAAGNVYVADANNQRIRRIGADGTITTVAGAGVQTLSGDGGLAGTAGLNTPGATALSPGGLVTLADAGNARVRQISASGTTVGGTGVPLPDALTIVPAPAMVYGTCALTASLATGSVATGSVAFFESAGSGARALGSAMLTGNVATLGLPGLGAGLHQVFAMYAGDPTHAVARSATSAVSIVAAPVTGTVGAASMVYGDAVPVLTGTLGGVLAQDAGAVGLVLSTTAGLGSPAGSYPIAGVLSGPAAGNYLLTPLAGAAVTISRAPTSATLSVAAVSVAAGDPVTVTLAVASGTSGMPTGNVTVLDGGALLGTVALSGGSGSFTTTALSLGTHRLSAAYAGDGNFLGSAVAGPAVAVVPIAAGDFALAVAGQAGQTVAAGSLASFNFTVQMQGAALASPIALTASALPAGVTASFSPSSLPPGGAVTAFTLTVQTTKSTAGGVGTTALVFGGLVGLLLPFGWRRRLRGSLVLAGLMVMVGCGDRILSTGAAAVVSYAITVAGTATTAAGAVLQHTAVVTVRVQ